MFVIIAFLVSESRKGRESKWYYLIKNLPDDVEIPVFWEN
jgi:hypothetical protein